MSTIKLAMDSPAETTVLKKRKVSLATINANASNPSDAQQLLTLVVEMLRCLEGVKAQFDTDLTEAEMLNEIRKLLPKCGMEKWLTGINKAYTNVAPIWGWPDRALALLPILMEMPGFVNWQEIDQGTAIEDNSDLLRRNRHYVEGSQYKNVEAKVRDIVAFDWRSWIPIVQTAGELVFPEEMFPKPPEMIED